MWIYWRGWRNFISHSTFTLYFLAVFSLLFTQRWQITYFGLPSMSHLSLLKRKRNHSVVHQSVYIIFTHPLSCQPCRAEPLPCNPTWGCSPSAWPNRLAWRSTRGVWQRAQPHFYHNTAIVAWHTTVVSSASPEQAGSVVQAIKLLSIRAHRISGHPETIITTWPKQQGSVLP